MANLFLRNTTEKYKRAMEDGDVDQSYRACLSIQRCLGFHPNH